MGEEKTADKKGIAGDSVKAFGKGMEPWGAPFSIERQRGLYYYVPAEHFDRLRELNELAGKAGLPELKVVGRGGMSGNRPFALKGGLYVCVLAEHARRLQEIMQGAVETEIAPAIVAKEMKVSIADNPEPTTVQEIAPVEKEGIMPADAKITTTMPEMAVQERQQQTVLTAEEMRDRDGEEKTEQRPEGRYVYCIINANGKNKTKSFGKIGLGSEEVYCIDYKNVSAVVSNFDGIDCGLSEENARVHNEVILHVMKRTGSVLPVGFGAVFASGKILKGVLGGAYHALKEEMKGIENKVELGLKIVANKQGAESPANNAPEEALKSLGKIAAKTHKGKPFMERMLLNASFLVERGRVDEFSRRVEELEKKYSDTVKLQYTGPWPPYNFVSVRIGAKEGGG